MNGREIIEYVVRDKMPDREQVRENCHRQAESGTRKNCSKWLIRAVPISTCVVVVIIAVFVFGNNGLYNLPLVLTSSAPPPIQTEEKSQNDSGDPGGNSMMLVLSDEEWPSEPMHRAIIPKLDLPEKTTGVEVEYDMIGLFVYQGRFYTQAAWYYNEDAKYIRENLIGEKIGFAKGNIDEWSTQDEYASEFAGSAYGDVYTVKGYDKGFRLCMTGISETPAVGDDGVITDENGNALREWVNFYECLNGYGITNGYDLFVFDSFFTDVNRSEILIENVKDVPITASRILSGNWNHVKYQNHDNWNGDSRKYVYHDLTGVTDEEITAFLYEVYCGQFENVYETVGVTFYSPEREQTHLYIYMDDKTKVELRLFEGGYVGYWHLGWYFVKIPGEAFDKVFSACK